MKPIFLLAYSSVNLYNNSIKINFHHNNVNETQSGGSMTLAQRLGHACR